MSKSHSDDSQLCPACSQSRFSSSTSSAASVCPIEEAQHLKATDAMSINVPSFAGPVNFTAHLGDAVVHAIKAELLENMNRQFASFQEAQRQAFEAQRFEIQDLRAELKKEREENKSLLVQLTSLLSNGRIPAPPAPAPAPASAPAPSTASGVPVRSPDTEEPRAAGPGASPCGNFGILGGRLVEWDESDLEDYSLIDAESLYHALNRNRMQEILQRFGPADIFKITDRDLPATPPAYFRVEIRLVFRGYELAAEGTSMQKKKQAMQMAAFIMCRKLARAEQKPIAGSTGRRAFGPNASMPGAYSTKSMPETLDRDEYDLV